MRRGLGFFCPPASSTPFGAGACPLGRYCPTPRHTGGRPGHVLEDIYKSSYF